ncbi:MAG: lamin tail domain-containing protein [Chloroflexota bacterium]|nr:lamin tail domain-containing protein [Chloroflexota bacterium]
MEQYLPDWFIEIFREARTLDRVAFAFISLLIIIAAVILPIALLSSSEPPPLIAELASGLDSLEQTDSLSPDEAVVVSIVASQSELHSGPGQDSHPVGSVTEGQKLNLVATSEDGQWHKLHTGEWIAADAVAEPPAELPVEEAVAEADSDEPTAPQVDETAVEAQPDDSVEPSAATAPAIANFAAELRAGPGQDSDTTGSVAEGQELNLVATSEDGQWYQLESGGWIAADALEDPPADLPVAATEEETTADEPSTTEDEEPAEETQADGVRPRLEALAAAVANFAAELRAGPGQDSDTAGSVAEGQELNLVATSEDGQWYQLESGGWIAADALEDPPADLPVALPEEETTADEPSTTEDEEPAEETQADGVRPRLEALAAAVANFAAELRAGPGQDSDTAGSVAEGQELNLVATSEDGQWYQLESGGWIAADALEDPPADLPVASSEELTEAGEQEPGDFRPTLGQVTSAVTNLATELKANPDWDAAVTGIMAKGRELILVARSEDGNWFQAQSGEWIAAEALEDPPEDLPVAATEEETTADEPSTTEEEEPAEETQADGVRPRLEALAAAVANFAAELRARPGQDSDTAGSVAEGQELNLVATSEDGQWYQLESGEWIAADALEDPPEDLPVAAPEEETQASAAQPSSDFEQVPRNEIRITAIRKIGSKGKNEPNEWVEISNLGGTSRDLTGWRLESDRRGNDDGQIFHFPLDFVLEPGQSCRVFTNQDHPEWCGLNFHHDYGEIWDNIYPDAAVLIDKAGMVVDGLWYRYGDLDPYTGIPQR